jgi:hypothetical protein
LFGKIEGILRNDFGGGKLNSGHGHDSLSGSDCLRVSFMLCLGYNPAAHQEENMIKGKNPLK